MEKVIINIYNYFETHPWMRRISLATFTVCMLLNILTLSYREDIEDFLPLNSIDHKNLDIYQQISGANELVVLFDNPNSVDSTIIAIDKFAERVQASDSCHWTKNMISFIDEDAINKIVNDVYQNIPYFLTDSDYQRIDSLLANPEFIKQGLTNDCDMLQFPTGGFTEENICRDPLGLFLPILQKLQSFQRESHFKQVDGYIFTPDMKRALVLIPSPFGNSETEQNSKLIKLVNNAIENTTKTCPSVHVHITGGPSIAVTNASRIKKDTILTISLASVLIIILLIYSFRSFRNIALTGLTIIWGGLFALAGIALINSQVSLIVLGISSIIIGIAFNYPLHLINHIAHTYSTGTRQAIIRQTLKEITRPLLIGNITTVGAFLALVPLKSTALRDLGIFASLLLLGTILFVLIYLPHMVKYSTENTTHKIYLIDRLSHLQLEKSHILVMVVGILSVIFGLAAFSTQFDPIISHINYMSKQQRIDMDYFQSWAIPEVNDEVTTVYMVSSANTEDKALEESEKHMYLVDSLTTTGAIKTYSGITSYVPSDYLQKHRIERWERFIAEHHQLFYDKLPSTSSELGFTTDAFADFYAILDKHYKIQPFKHFDALTSTVFKQNLCHDENVDKQYIIDKLYVPNDKVLEVENLVPGTFDIQTVNSNISNSITDDFNYIGWASSLIVFFFLWYSFKSLKLAIISFMPMAMSWIWILGIMALCGLKFNIVNIILSTFIFGQGDDYTIFMTEGCLYEQKYHKPMLTSYKNSIMLSAVIMFAGIGVLIMARHPALQSLGIITVVGMLSVVLMAYLIPPLMFTIFNNHRVLQILEKIKISNKKNERRNI